MISESLLSQINTGRKGNNWGFSLGLPKLERITDGVTKNTYTLIMSPSGIGKTSVALFSYIYKPLCEHLDDGNFKITYFSLEISAELLFAKLLSLHIFETYGVELSTKELLSRKKNYKLSDEHYKIVEESLPWLKKVENILTVYDKGLNAKSLYTLLMSDLEKEGTFEETEGRKIYIPNNSNLVHLVVIDHLSLCRPSSGHTLKEEMDLISSYLVTLRNMCKISPLVIMQVNRNSTSMDRRKEGMSNITLNDAKDSGSPIQDSEIVLSLFSPHREKLSTYRGYDIKRLQHNFRTITCLKNRYGESDIEIGCAFYGKVGYFAELPKPEDIYDYEKYETSDWVLHNSTEDQTSKIEDKSKSNFNFML